MPHLVKRGFRICWPSSGSLGNNWKRSERHQHRHGAFTFRRTALGNRRNKLASRYADDEGLAKDFADFV
jgi:hypothetical protein